MKKIWEKVLAFIVSNIEKQERRNMLGKKYERALWEEEKRLALEETKNIHKWGEKCTCGKDVEDCPDAYSHVTQGY